MSKAIKVDTPKKNLRMTLILFLSIVAGIFFFMLVSVLFIQARGPLSPDLNKKRVILIAAITGISFACLLGARAVFTKGMADAKNSLNGLIDKLNLHRNTLIKYVIVCEMPVMLGIILFVLTGDFIFQVFAAVFIGFMLTVIPLRKKTIEQLELNTQEQSQLD